MPNLTACPACPELLAHLHVKDAFRGRPACALLCFSFVFGGTLPGEAYKRDIAHRPDLALLAERFSACDTLRLLLLNAGVAAPGAVSEKGCVGCNVLVAACTLGVHCAGLTYGCVACTGVAGGGDTNGCVSVTSGAAARLRTGSTNGWVGRTSGKV